MLRLGYEGGWGIFSGAEEGPIRGSYVRVDLGSLRNGRGRLGESSLGVVRLG